MRAKAPDGAGRVRPVTIGFRVTREQSAAIDELVAISGMTKQDYIASRLAERGIIVTPNARVQQALARRMDGIYVELRRVSGTTGITGSADSTMVLERASRGSSSATLVATGRDVEHQELRLRFQSHRWELVGCVSQEEIEERKVPGCVVAVLAFALSVGGWSGTAPALAEAVGAAGVSPAVLGKRIAQHSGFLGERGVFVMREHTRAGNVIRSPSSRASWARQCPRRRAWTSW